MKIIQLIKSSGARKPLKAEVQRYILEHNTVEVHDLYLLTYILHSKCYSHLRSLKTNPYDYGIIMRNKKGFNTHFFNINFDVVIVDSDGKIIETLESVPPSFVSKHYPNAYYISFFSSGTIKYYNFNKHDFFKVRKKRL